MDNELSRYIATYFTYLLTTQEKLGLHHLRSKYRIENPHSRDNIQQRIQAYKRTGWLTEDKKILELVSSGEEELDRKIAEQILSQHRDRVFINNCPKCGRLARTPFAKQCRHCGHSWR
jgi:hypothetical protein